MKFGNYLNFKKMCYDRFVNPFFVFYPIAQHRKKLEIKSSILVELSLALSGIIYIS